MRRGDRWTWPAVVWAAGASDESRSTVIRIRIFSLPILALLLGADPSAAVSPLPSAAANGMVVTAQRYASDVGVEILREGGNAVDAAVAVGYALAVVLPCCGNIGGGGFATLHL